MYCVISRVRTLTLCGCLLLTASSSAAEQGDNAALAYWQAFALLPTFEEDMGELVKQASTVELDDRTRELADKSRTSISCLRRAAAMRSCDFGVDLAAGPHAVMPHLSKVRQLARYACLYARHQIADGHEDSALETIRDTLVLARHAGVDDVLISVLVQDAVEQTVIETVSRELPRFDAMQLDALIRILDELPEGGSMADSLKLEQRVYVGWARRVVSEADSDREAAEQLRDMVVPKDEAPAVTGVTRQQISKWLRGTTQDYQELQTIFDLPEDEFQPRWDALMDRIGDGNPFSSVVLPSVKSLREVRNRNTADWALFRAAIAIQRDGGQRVASTKDPFGDGPFKYTELESGFRLTSQLKFRGDVVELTVGEGND